MRRIETIQRQLPPVAMAQRHAIMNDVRDALAKLDPNKTRGQDQIKMQELILCGAAEHVYGHALFVRNKAAIMEYNGWNRLEFTAAIYGGLLRGKHMTIMQFIAAYLMAVPDARIVWFQDERSASKTGTLMDVSYLIGDLIGGRLKHVDFETLNKNMLVFKVRGNVRRVVRYINGSQIRGVGGNVLIVEGASGFPPSCLIDVFLPLLGVQGTSLALISREDVGWFHDVMESGKALTLRMA